MSVKTAIKERRWGLALLAAALGAALLFSLRPASGTRVTAVGSGTGVAEKMYVDDITLTDVTEEMSNVHVSVLVSAQFFGWLAGLHGIVDLVAPSSTVQQYREWARGLVK